MQRLPSNHFICLGKTGEVTIYRMGDDIKLIETYKPERKIRGSISTFSIFSESIQAVGTDEGSICVLQKGSLTLIDVKKDEKIVGIAFLS